MSNTRHLLAAIPVATLALALAACTPPEQSPPMDPPADVETAPADDPWTQPEAADQPAPADPTEVVPIDDPWDQPPADQPPALDQPPTPIDPTLDPTDEQMPPPEPEEVVDPVDP